MWGITKGGSLKVNKKPNKWLFYWRRRWQLCIWFIIAEKAYQGTLIKVEDMKSVERHLGQNILWCDRMVKSSKGSPWVPALDDEGRPITFFRCNLDEGCPVLVRESGLIEVFYPGSDYAIFLIPPGHARFLSQDVFDAVVV